MVRQGLSVHNSARAWAYDNERGILMEDVRKETEAGQAAGRLEQAADSGKQDDENCAQESRKSPVSDTWAQETIEDLDDFIESQGVYIRQ